MTRWLVLVVCSLGLAVGCDDDAGTPGGGTGGAPGSGGIVGGGDAAPDVPGSGGSGAMDANRDGSDAASDGGSDAKPDALADGGDAGAPDGGSDTSTAETSAPAAMTFNAAAGGTLTVGGASLLVPGGVLTADKMLTLSVRAPAADEPGRANIIGDIYEFGPDGTTFAVPVALTLPLPAPVAADMRVVVAWLDTASAQWFPLATTVAGDKVTALVSHFTRFALLQLPKDQMCPYGGACGGSLDGTWKYTQACLKAEESVAFECGTAGSVKLRQEYLIGGSVSFAQGRYTGEQMITGSATLFYTPACMALLRESVVGADCATLQQAWREEGTKPNQPVPQWICAGTVAQGCSCKLTNAFNQAITGSFAVEGSKVTFTQDGKAPGGADDFCVQGSNLSVKTASGDVYTAIKQ